MPLIYLQHPQHGAKIATLELEAEHDEQNGWTRFDPDAPKETIGVSENSLVRKRKRVDNTSEKSET